MEEDWFRDIPDTLDKKKAKTVYRNFIEKCIDKRKLSSLDELMGTIFSILSVTFAALALVFTPFRESFAILTIFTTVFFWIGYRVAKILHAIELKVWIAESSIIYLFYGLGYTSLTLLSSVLDTITLVILLYASIGLTAIFLWILDSKKLIWNWIKLDGFDDLFCDRKYEHSRWLGKRLLHISPLIRGYYGMFPVLLIFGILFESTPFLTIYTGTLYIVGSIFMIFKTSQAYQIKAQKLVDIKTEKSFQRFNRKLSLKQVLGFMLVVLVLFIILQIREMLGVFDLQHDILDIVIVSITLVIGSGLTFKTIPPE